MKKRDPMRRESRQESSSGTDLGSIYADATPVPPAPKEEMWADVERHISGESGASASRAVRGARFPRSYVGWALAASIILAI